MKKLLFFSLFIVLFSGLSLGQEVNDSTQLWRIETQEGNEFIGRILERNTSQIVITSALYGEITLSLANIKKLDPVDENQLKNNELWIENPQATRYYWAPNGYGLKKGEGYYQNVWVLFNQASYGLTNNFSVGVGMMPLFLFAGAPTPIWITPKFSFPVIKDQLNLGVGVLYVNILGEDADPLGLAYGVATLGNRDANLTFGLGYGFAGGEWGKTPVFTLSGMFRVSRKGYLISENYLISDSGENVSMLMLGGRTVWPKVSVDYGLVFPVVKDMDMFLAMPWLSFVVPFGNY